jgi:peptidoglycan/xylan/chitin deacetylase (PgdA/CDA1 family)
MTKSVLLLALRAAPFLRAQQTPPPSAAPAAIPAAPPLPDDGSRVAILGYHELAENLPETAMRIHTSKFRKQMETVRDLGLNVISMEKFLAWKAGKADIPKDSVLITFDDGWKSVYTDAWPVLRELGFPFTIYLYKSYVDGGGKALTTPMIEEMIAGGASVGSHSVSHPYPIVVKNYRKKGPKVFDTYLRKEMGDSKKFLETKFHANVASYAYPGGFYTQEMIALGHEFGYQAMFTVVPGKIKRSLPDETLPRYIILGNYDKIFELATSFQDNRAAAPAADAPVLAQTTPYPVSPEAGAIVNSRLPEISVDLTNVENLDPASLSMTVAGFGLVPAVYFPETHKYSWQVNRRLRQPACQIAVTWKDTAGKAPETPLRWSFTIDRESAYLPDGD